MMRTLLRAIPSTGKLNASEPYSTPITCSTMMDTRAYAWMSATCQQVHMSCAHIARQPIYI
eukprot:41415-Eustigmatos_ZCMA.PRE.1